MTLSRTDQIQQLIQEKLQPSFLEVIDQSQQHIGHAGAQTGKGHFQVNITCDKFANAKTLECHRMIYAALGEMMENDIHALSINIQR